MTRWQDPNKVAFYTGTGDFDLGYNTSARRCNTFVINWLCYRRPTRVRKDVDLWNLTGLMCGDFVAPVLVARLVEPISGSASFAMTCFTEDEYIRQSHLRFCAKTYYPWQQRHHFLQKISQDWRVCGQTSVDRVYYMVDWCLVLGSPWSHYGIIEQLQVMLHLRLLKRIPSEAS